MARYAITDAQGSVNIVEWDGDLAKWQPPAGSTYRLATAADQVTPRNLTAEAIIRGKLDEANADLRTYLALASPSAANNTAAIKTMARAMVRLIRLINVQTDSDT